MSRIDEALRRASGNSAAGLGSSVAPAAVEQDDAVDAALWDFPDDSSQVPPAPAAKRAAEPGVDTRRAVPVTPDDAVVPLHAEAPQAQVARAAAAVTAAAVPAAAAVTAAAAPAAAPTAAAPAAAVPVHQGELSAAVAMTGPAAATPPMRISSKDRHPVVQAPNRRGDIIDTLVTGTHRKDAIEQYRKMAATLHHVQVNRNIRVLLCTSAVMAEGKTVTAANLALTLSLSYQRRVLLIDADLRRPRIHTIFNLPNTEGLFEALRAPSDRKVATTAVSPWLSVVTAGRPGVDPVGVLTSERLARVVEDAGASFDWVIIDTPPVLVLPDAGLLMGVVDAALLVIGAGQTSYRMAKRAADSLGRDRIVGVVMNRTKDAVLEEGYGQYYGYYASATGTE